ncbi:MAG: hypothetical protein HXL33_04650 [Prevotellaceae bacterium]|nr:hypothetical protein [Prevotellaceae bacterium]
MYCYNRFTITIPCFHYKVHCSAAVSHAADGRHTHRSTVAVRAAGGRRTTNITL